MIGLVAFLVIVSLIVAILSVVWRAPLWMAVILLDLAILVQVWPGGK